MFTSHNVSMSKSWKTQYTEVSVCLMKVHHALMLQVSNSSSTERHITDFLQLAGGSYMGRVPQIMFLHKAGVKTADRTSSFLQLFNASGACRRICWHQGLFISFSSNHISNASVLISSFALSNTLNKIS